MKILSVDTSSRITNVSLSIYENEKQIKNKCIAVDDMQTHAQKLMPAIKELLESENIKVEELDLIGVVVGPGSFTGVRIGISTVKGLVFPFNIPVVPISSLELLLENVKKENREIDYKTSASISVIDARNNQVYAGIRLENKKSEHVTEFAGDILEFLKLLETKIKENEEIDTIYIVGSGKEIFKKYIQEIKSNILNNINIIEIEEIEQKDEYLAELIYRNKDKKIEGKNVLPSYLKPSQAERMKKDK